jgi:hypothetical protein
MNLNALAVPVTRVAIMIENGVVIKTVVTGGPVDIAVIDYDHLNALPKVGANIHSLMSTLEYKRVEPSPEEEGYLQDSIHEFFVDKGMPT